MTSTISLPPLFNRGDAALYIGPLLPNDYGRWPRRGQCTIVSTPHDPEHRDGLRFVIAFKPGASQRAQFLVHLSELLPLRERGGIEPANPGDAPGERRTMSWTIRRLFGRRPGH